MNRVNRKAAAHMQLLYQAARVHQMERLSAIIDTCHEALETLDKEAKRGDMPGMSSGTSDLLTDAAAVARHEATRMAYAHHAYDMTDCEVAS